MSLSQICGDWLSIITQLFKFCRRQNLPIENYVRYVCDDKHAVLFLADFADKETRASTVMKKWYAALVNAKK